MAGALGSIGLIGNIGRATRVHAVVGVGSVKVSVLAGGDSFFVPFSNGFLGLAAGVVGHATYFPTTSVERGAVDARLVTSLRGECPDGGPTLSREVGFAMVVRAIQVRLHRSRVQAFYPPTKGGVFWVVSVM